MKTIIGLILCGIVILAVFAYFFYFIRSFFIGTKQAPYVGSFGRQLKLMKSKLKLDKNSKLIDLGCGDGKALRFFTKYFQTKQAIGYDINLFAILWGNFINTIFQTKNIELIHSKFEKADLSKYDYIYIFLFTKQVSTIENRIFDKKKPDCMVICNTFPCSNHKPYKILTDGKSKIYLYK